MTAIIEVKTSRDLDEFITFPFSLYSKDSLFVPPLIKEMREKFSSRNPFFHHARAWYFLAKKDGTLSGRVAAIINYAHIESQKEKAGFFGFFESINDYSVASALLDRVSEKLRNEGLEIIRGPMNFSTNEECGFLLEGFSEPPVFMTPYNPPYYNDLMEYYGMKKAKDLYAYTSDIPEELPEKVLRVAAIAEKKGIHVRPINNKKIDLEMKIFREVYNSAWEKNWGFIPITVEETLYMAQKLKPLVLPELTVIAEIDREPVGFMGVLPDYNFVLKKMKGKFNLFTIAKALYYSRKIPDLRLLLLGIKAEYRNKGVDAILFREGFGAKKEKYRQFKRVEFSWVLEDNIQVQMLVEIIGARLYKKYRVYEKRL